MSANLMEFKARQEAKKSDPSITDELLNKLFPYLFCNSVPDTTEKGTGGQSVTIINNNIINN